MRQIETKHRLHPKTLALVKSLQVIALILMLLAVFYFFGSYWRLLTGFLFITNMLVIVAFWLDKQRAIKQQERISEKALVSLGLMGLHIGSLFARRWLKHKTISLGFNLKIVLSQFLLIAAGIATYQAWYVI